MCKEEDKSYVDTPKGKCWYDVEAVKAEMQWRNNRINLQDLIFDRYSKKAASVIAEERMKRSKL